MTTTLHTLRKWVEEVATVTQPADIHWCSGSDDEYDELVRQMLADGTLTELNQDNYPGCYLHLSDPSDVARVEHLTYVCTETEEEAGQNNNWMDPTAAHAKMDALFEGCMRGRKMYVIPYCMGPITSRPTRAAAWRSPTVPMSSST